MDIISRKEAKQQNHRFYFTGAPCKLGHVSKRVASSCVCYQCQLEATAKWKQTFKDDHPNEHKLKARRQSKKQRDNNPVSVLLASAKRRARERGLECTITHQDIVIPDRCPVTGITLEVNTGRQADNSPSLDRVDNSKGYIPGNVRVVSWRINQCKSDLSISEILSLAKYVRGEV